MKSTERILMVATLGLAVIAAAIAFVYVAREAHAPGPGSAWRYDVSSFEAVDPSLLAYRDVHRIDLGFTVARGLAVDRDDNLYAVGDAELRVFDAQGRPTRQRALSGIPRCLAVAEDGRVFIGTGNRVAVWRPRDDHLEYWPETGARGRITSVAIHDGTIIVADAGNRTVSTHAPDGTRRVTLTQAGAESGLVVPSGHLDVAVAPDGTVLLVNPGRLRIETWTLDGRLLWAWGQPSFGIEGFSGCCNPTDIAVLANGDIVTAEKGLPRIKVHQAETGDLLAVVASPDAFGESAAGIDLAVDSHDRIIALDPLRGEAVIYDRVRTTQPNNSCDHNLISSSQGTSP